MLCPRRFIAVAIVLLSALLSVGFVHGLWTDRWASGSAEEIMEMEKLPFVAGAWEGTTIKEDSANRILDTAGRYLSRRYVNHADGTVASMMLTRGRPGPMVIKHLPTECYVSSGFEMVGQPKRYLSENDKGPADEFWVATFKKSTDVLPVIVRVYWSWSATGRWQTPDRPRFTFARYPTLYKLYVVQALPSEDEPFEGAPVHDLIKKLTVAMRGSIFSSSLP
jgi:hypothetical protein